MSPPSTESVHAGAPAEPRFVKIWITPPAASVPYSVVAAGPFTTSTRSMSAGLMPSRALMSAPASSSSAKMEPFSIRTPSM